ncbi:hypothetical protein BOX15_Mlig012391g1, partial [Macrostomum lignano]
ALPRHYVVHRFVKITLKDLSKESSQCDPAFGYVLNNNSKKLHDQLAGLLNKQQYLYVRDKAGWTLLHYAVLCGHRKITALLCQCGFDVNIKCDVSAFGVTGWRAIHIAAEKGDSDTLKLLISYGASCELMAEVAEAADSGNEQQQQQPDATAVATSGLAERWNAVHMAVFSESVESVRACLQRGGAYVDTRTLRRQTPLMLACKSGCLAIVQLLLTAGASLRARDSQGNTPLHYAAQSPCPETLRQILQDGARADAVNSAGQLPLHNAAQSRSSGVQNVQLLLDTWPSGLEAVASLPDLNIGAGATPLIAAVATPGASAVTEKLELLLSRGADINRVFEYNSLTGVNALRLLIETRSINTDLVHYLLSNGVNVDSLASDGVSPLLCAAQKGSVVMVTKLCKYSPNPNVADRDGYTALMYAVKCRNSSLVRTLLELKPDLEIAINFYDARRNKYANCTPLQMAIGKGQMEIVKMLLDAGANLFANMDSMGPDQTEFSVSCLHTAVVMDHAGIGQLLLDRGVDVNVCTSSGLTPLHYAASWGHDAFAKLLLSRGATVDAVGEQFMATPLIYAARRDKHTTMRLLLEHGANPNHQDKQGYTALHWCLTFNHVDSLDVLLNCGRKLDVNLISQKVDHRRGVTALVLGLEYCSAKVVERLLEMGSDPNVIFDANEMTLTPIFLCAEFGCVDKLQLLIKYGADLNRTSSRKETPLHFALRFKKVAAAERLIRAGADLETRASIGNGEHQQGVHVAAQLGLNSCIRLLAEYGANVNSTMTLKCVERVTPLHLAALNDLSETVKILVMHGADVNCQRSDTFTPLLTAVTKSNVCAVKCLVRAGADIHTRCIVSRSKDATCLHIAAQVGSLEIVDLLLERGANPLARMVTGDRAGILPVHLASETGHLDVIKRFLDIGVDVNAQEDCGLTCLHYAANGGKADIIKLLLERGARVDLKAAYDDGNRVDVLPLHMACEKGNAECARLLVEAGSPLDATLFRNRRGNITPLYLAVAENNPEVVSVLLAAGSDVNIQDGIGAAPLHISCQRGYHDIFCQLLCHPSVNVNIATFNGVTPIHIVSEKGHFDMAMWLIARGVNVNPLCRIKDVHSGQMSEDIIPLNQACGFGHLQIVKLLLQNGADVHHGENFEGRRGIASIHCAAIRGRHHVIPLLRKFGANLNATDEQGWSPLHWAVHERFYDTVLLLLQNGADPRLLNQAGQRPIQMATTNDITSVLERFEAQLLSDGEPMSTE